MSTRLATGGRFIDRRQPLGFSFNGKRLTGYAGDTLASALLAQDQMLVGRSFKYHRPRGLVAAGAEEPNALVNLGSGDRLEPNQRATTTELFEGLEARSQNHWPSLEVDVGAVNQLFARFLPAGFYYKMFIHPRPLWKHVYEPFIRQSAGLGKAPDARDPDTYEHMHANVDVLVVGGGVAGLEAALTAGRAGRRVMLVEQTAHWGGRALLDGAAEGGARIDGEAGETWVKTAVEALEEMPNVTLRTRCMGAGVYDHGAVIAHERLTDHLPGAAGPRHRLWRIRAGRIVLATGAIERPLAFAGNDRPGVMLASAVRDYISGWGVSPGDRTVIAANNDDAYRTALAIHHAGLEVAAILDARPAPSGPLVQAARDLGLRILPGKGIAKVKGRGRVEGVAVCAQAGEGSVLEEIACDCVAMSGGWSPVVHLWSHTGGKLTWDAERAFFRPDPDRAPTGADGRPNVAVVGTANGHLGTEAALGDAARQVAALVGGKPVSHKVDEPAEGPILPVWLMPQGAKAELRAKMWLDYQNDVKVTDVQLAAREGFESVEHTKRYTTLGMATDQGKLSNINGLAVLARALGEDIPQVGTTTFRPPYTPISMGSIAGEAKDALFQPVRRTPMQDWHEARGAYLEPVGHWRRPYCYPRAGESHAEAVAREITAVRSGLGLLDASTLGKIVVKGPDAGRFLDMLYTNMMSNLAVGRCRYGLMCSENGFLMDDGVVARLSEDSWLCHTTSGGADRVHAHMEEWLQTEWWDWKVHTVNLTEQYAQVAVVGPQARRVLEKLGGLDVSGAEFRFMDWREGRLGGHPVRAFRISFSGELSYEIATPAGQGLALWEKLLEAGEEFGVTPYGTEALHVMRAEKGFIMIGDETDGTVIPQDLGLDWAISKKKADYIGKRAQARSHMTDPARWKLVGLETLDGSVLPEGAYALAEGRTPNGQRATEGRVTSTYHSPTLGRGIAMGLVLRGPERMGEELEFNTVEGGSVRARIVSPVFYDAEGEKQNV
ncbi:sarcosine oxidase subunit alpha family protein [Histidinibacterium lentulum]|uniref:Sarcosine oxidase subunit alpha family protein n=1 Tax=Histidinibacterium lentulum TaxID=2480588 RepID=A0A3N2QY00_9RHOB|nr:sarcosine oxidase subunit alpha family protein [Histidinibacterium lentulum]ROU00104.1 sarcosine oxidase subunit alpha family protein [Histidinibacterium lentulum]